MSASLILNDFACGFFKFASVDLILQIILFLFITESCINKGV